MKKSVCFVVSSPMTVNAFLIEPIRRLSEHCDIHLLVNMGREEAMPGLEGLARTFPMEIAREILPWVDLRTIFRMFLFFRRNRFHVVHSVTPKAGLLAMTAAFFAGVKTRIHTFTGQVWVTRTGPGRWLLKNIDRCIGWMATDILIDSPSQRRFLLEQGVVSDEKSGVLADGSISGVDISRFRPDDVARRKIRRELSVSEEDTLFLYLGRLSRDKGLLDLASAFAGINHSGVHLVLVGPDEQEIASQMKKYAGEKAGQIQIVGFTDKPQEYFAAADVLCIPSYREGFGNAVIEAAAVGVPAIASRIYGLMDAVSENESGLLFEAGNVEELKTCLSVLCEDRGLRIRLGRQARKRVIEKFSSEKMAWEWVDYYRARL